MINRDTYLNKLIEWKDTDLIKVITGIRRCGKSTIFDIYINYLKEHGIDSKHIIYYNFENPDNDFENYKELYDNIKSQLKDKKKYYVFLDEIQKIDNFEKAVDGLYLIKNVDIYITGSNAFLLSGELATFLSGRYIPIKMYPLSFKEFVTYQNIESTERAYLEYTNKSSFPYATQLKDQQKIDDYLDALYSTIIVKDISQRKKTFDIPMLKTVAKFMFANIGNLLSIKKIADTLTSDGRSISAHTVEDYIDALVEAFIFNKVSRYDIKGKQYLKSGEKYYATDSTMRYAVLGRRNIDLGHMLENVVYLELLRRGYKVYIGKNGEKEIDFVAENKEGFQYYQVVYTVREEKTLKRELSPLEEIKDHYPKYILTMDVDSEVDYNGIRKMNVLDWLMDKS